MAQTDEHTLRACAVHFRFRNHRRGWLPAAFGERVEMLRDTEKSTNSSLLFDAHSALLHWLLHTDDTLYIIWISSLVLVLRNLSVMLRVTFLTSDVRSPVQYTLAITCKCNLYELWVAVWFSVFYEASTAAIVCGLHPEQRRGTSSGQCRLTVSCVSLHLGM